jgi:hypothetical protein
MKEKIKSVFGFYSLYDIVEEWEDERYYYIRLDDGIITSIVLRDLIEEGLKFSIDLFDLKDERLVIAFCKE